MTRPGLPYLDTQPSDGLAVDHVLKVLVLGDSGVGKTCLLTRFTSNSFDERLNTTIGVDFATKKISLHDARIKLTIWDTAGQEKFRTLTSTFYRGAKGVILVYDVTRRATLAHLEDTWLRELEQYGTHEGAVRMVVANKVDVGSERTIGWQEGSDFAQRHGCLYVETSAKANIAVGTAFEELVLKILESPSLLLPDEEGPNATRTIQLTGDDGDGSDDNHSGYCC